MGFFSALVKMLFKSEKSKTSEQKPKTVSSPKTNLFPYTEEDAAKFTADLIDGITEEQRSLIVKELCRLNRTDRGGQESVTTNLLQILGDADWHWKEWDYWQPRCVSEELWGWHMMFCSPYPDEIDWEKERAKTKPETIVNSLKAQEAKDLIKSYVADDIVIKTKSDVLSFLKNNPELFEKIRDRRIQERWDSKPHRTEASKEEIATLLAWTVWGRMSFIRNVVRCLSLGMKYRVYWLEDHDEEFFKVAKVAKDNPWKHKKILPNFPGGIADVLSD